MPATNKYVMQYPPGTGFVLALFPAGFQVIPLYVLANVIDLRLCAARDCLCARRRPRWHWPRVRLRRDLSDDQSDQGELFDGADHDGLRARRLSHRQAVCGGSRGIGLLLIALIGLLIGLSVNFRLPNLLLSAAISCSSLGAFLLARSRETFLQGAAFGIAFLIGMAPTLIANAINAGSPFATTYGGVDVAPPELNLERALAAISWMCSSPCW